MSRAKSPSLKVRGIPRRVLGALDAIANETNRTRNAIANQVIRDYANGSVTPRTDPPAFDPQRKGSPYGAETAPLAVSSIPADVFSRFMDRAKRDGWFSKNDLIVALLSEFVESQPD